MVLTLIVMFSGLILGLAGTGVIVSRGICSYFDRKQSQIELRLDAMIHDYIDPQGEGKPSRLADITTQLGMIVGAAAAQQIIKSLQTEQGHVGKTVNGLLAEQSPLLGLLSGGRRGKGAGLAKLAEMLAPMMAGGSGAGNGNNGNDSAYQGRRHRD